MTTHTQRLSIELASGTAPPDAFCIFTAGNVDTTKGTFLFDDEAAKLVLAAAAEWGNQHSIDFEHDAVNPLLGGPKPAAGWFALEVRNGELWAVDVRWTPRAAQMLTDREYRYVSPAFSTDRETNRVTELINVALTNLPATKAMTPLVANRGGANALAAKDATMTDDEKKLAEGEAPPADEKKDPEQSEKLFAANDAVMVGEKPGTVSEIAEGAFVKVAFEDGSAAWHPEGEVAAAGEPAPADEAASQVAASILSITGAKSIVQALGVIAAGKAALDELTKLRSQSKDDEAAKLSRERSEIVNKLKADKKLTPAQEQWAASVDIEALRSFAKVAPVITALSSPTVIEPVRGSNKRWEDFAPIELARLHDENPELYAALKADRDQRRASR